MVTAIKYIYVELIQSNGHPEAVRSSIVVRNHIEYSQARINNPFEIISQENEKMSRDDNKLKKKRPNSL